MNRESRFVRIITKTPDPEKTGGIFFQRVHADKYHNWYMKVYQKMMINGKIKYVFCAVYKTDW